MTMKIHLHKTFAAASLPFALGIISVFAPAARCVAQTQAQAQPQPGAQTTVAALHEPPAGAASDAGTNSKPAPSGPAATPDPDISAAVAKQLAAMQAEIEQLKAELKNHAAPEPPPAPAIAPAAKAAEPATTAAASPAVPVEQETQAGQSHPPDKPDANFGGILGILHIDRAEILTSLNRYAEAVADYDEAIRRLPAAQLSQFLPAPDADLTVQRYLASLEAGIGDPRLPLLTEGSRIFRAVVPRDEASSEFPLTLDLRRTLG